VRRRPRSLDPLRSEGDAFRVLLYTIAVVVVIAVAAVIVRAIT
jgi:hypothetical protein